MAACSALLLSLAIGVAAAAAQPGVPAPPRTVFAENFEHETGAIPVPLNAYIGANGERYTASPDWLGNCNGDIVNFARRRA